MWVVRDSNPQLHSYLDPVRFPTRMLKALEVALLIPAPVGVAAAVKFT